MNISGSPLEIAAILAAALALLVLPWLVMSRKKALVFLALLFVSVAIYSWLALPMIGWLCWEIIRKYVKK